jgi:hypothetical protein
LYDIYYKNEITNYFIFKTGWEHNIIDDFYYSEKQIKLNKSNSNHSLNLSINSNDISQIMITKDSLLTSNSRKNSGNKYRNSTDLPYHFSNDILEEINKESCDRDDQHFNSNTICNCDEKKNKIKNKNEILDGIEETDKLNAFKSLLIVRREHYCLLLPIKEDINISINDNVESNESSFFKSNDKLNIIRLDSPRKIKKMSIRHYKSYTDSNPYKDKLLKNDNIEINYGTAILKIRNSLRLDDEIIEKITPSVNPFEEEEEDNFTIDQY